MTKLLSIDASMKNTGYAIFNDTKLIEYGVIPEQRYKGQHLDRYPKKTSKSGILMAEQISILVKTENPDKIILEEAIPAIKSGIKSIKGLVMMHGIILYLLSEYIDLIQFVTPGEWRNASKIKLKKNGDFKKSSVSLVNDIFKLNLNYTQHDIADSILIGYSQI